MFNYNIWDQYPLKGYRYLKNDPDPNTIAPSLVKPIGDSVHSSRQRNYILYVFSVEDAAGNSRARERVDGIKKNQAASETRHTGVSALRASPIDRTADHWLTPAAIASRLCEPVRTNAKHKLYI
jgi:hypothetical protein